MDVSFANWSQPIENDWFFVTWRKWLPVLPVGCYTKSAALGPRFTMIKWISYRYPAPKHRVCTRRKPTDKLTIYQHQSSPHACAAYPNWTFYSSAHNYAPAPTSSVTPAQGPDPRPSMPTSTTSSATSTICHPPRSVHEETTTASHSHILIDISNPKTRLYV